jgi:hypothetical protein
MPVFAVVLIIIGVVALASFICWCVYVAERRVNQETHYRQRLHNDFWSIVSHIHINWDDDEFSE